jgi:hypothetical protein
VFVPGFGLLGAMSTLDSGMPVCWGMFLSGVLGLFFGLVFGGVRGPGSNSSLDWKMGMSMSDILTEPGSQR